MSDVVAISARSAAERLAPELGARLGQDVEAALHTRTAAQPPGQYVDPVELGGLIVSIATLAWTVYKDHTRKDPEPAPEVIARAVRVELEQAAVADPAARDRIVTVVVEETLAAAKRESL